MPALLSHIARTRCLVVLTPTYYVLFCSLCVCARAAVDSSAEHRLDAALRCVYCTRTHHSSSRSSSAHVSLCVCACSEAEEGFHACSVCGFENFKRFPFCNVCGAKILEHESQQQSSSSGRSKAKKSKRRKGTSATAALTLAASEHEDAHLPVHTTQRQQRARCVHNSACLRHCI